MFNKELADKIDKLIKEKFGIIYEYKFEGIVLLYGGTIKNVIMNSPSLPDLLPVLCRRRRLRYPNPRSGPELLLFCASFCR